MEKKFYRSIWISDIHLGTRDTRYEELNEFLSSVKCDYLYLVGDIIDTWALKKKWYWPDEYNKLLRVILKRSTKGAKVYYIPGNHDDIFRNFIGYKFGEIEICQDCIHETIDGKRLFIFHGDELDSVVQCHPWLAHFGCFAYEYLVYVNRILNKLRKICGLKYWSFSGSIKRNVKHIVKYLTNYETLVIAEANKREVDGVICGHLHQPKIDSINGILYCNTGDWVENCNALVEKENGKLELLFLDKS